MYTLVNLSQGNNKKNRYISPILEEKIEKCLKEKKKILLYNNRRGEYTSLVCKNCQHIYTCKNCDTSLSLHQNSSEMVCHTCGFAQHFSLECEKCHLPQLEKIGIGTQQIERHMSERFPNAHIFRFDSDSIKTKKEKETAISTLKKSDIIIGTKMITTGIDIDNIALIGVILIEQAFIFPLYDTYEKAFSTIKQLIGRSGRKGQNSEIILQTFIPNNLLITLLLDGNYQDFVQSTLKERKLFGYPPYQEIAYLEYRHISQEKAYQYISHIKDKLEHINRDKKYELLFSGVHRKKYKQFYYTLSVKGENIKDLLEVVRQEIMLNPGLSIRFS